MPTVIADFDREAVLSPAATLMDQLALIPADRARKRPHLALVIASVILAVGLWLAIYAVSGRVVWTG